MSASAEEKAVAAVGGAGAAPEEAVGPPANKRTNATSLHLCAVMTVYGEATFAVLNKFLGDDAEPDEISRRSKTTKKVGAFSDKGITYYIAKDYTDETNEEGPDFIHIDFLKEDSPYYSVGKISIYLGAETAELGTIESAYSQYKGAGSRMMTVFEDIARLGDYDTVVLKSVPSAVGFYLGLESPYNFVHPHKNGIVYNKALRKARESLKEGQSARNAMKAAAKTFVIPDIYTLIHLKKTFPKKRRTRRNNRRRTRSQKK